MSNASLKDQLKAVANQLSVNLEKNTQKAPSPKRNPKKSKSANKPRPAWLEYAQRGLALLRSHYPHAFYTGDKVQPLKKGIKQDLISHLDTLKQISTEDKDCMIKSLSFYVNTIPYLKKVIAGASRIDLDGKVAGEISADEAKYSLERLQAKQAAKTKPKRVEKN